MLFILINFVPTSVYFVIISQDLRNITIYQRIFFFFKLKIDHRQALWYYFLKVVLVFFLYHYISIVNMYLWVNS